MQIHQYIQELLLQHDCVILPGLGGFIGNRRSAQVDNLKQQLLPPSKAITFNKFLNRNDGLLANAIATAEGLDYDAAAEKVERFVEACKRQLDQQGTVIFPEVGKLFYNDNDYLTFLPSYSQNFLMDSFGLKPVSYSIINKREAVSIAVEESVSIPQSEPAITIPEEPKKVIESNKRKTVEKKRVRRKGPALAVSSLLILVLVGLMVFQVPPGPLTLNNLGFGNINWGGMTQTDEATEGITDESEKEIIQTKVEAVPASIEVELKDAAFEPEKEPYLAMTAETAPEGYYVILGAYSSEANAKKFIKNFNDPEVQSNMYVLPVSDKAFRVGAYVQSDVANAEAQLDNFRSNTNSQAWLLENRI